MGKKYEIAIIGVKGLPAIGGSARANENLIRHLSSKYNITVYEIESKSGNAFDSDIKKHYKSVKFKASRLKRINTFLYYLKACLHALFVGKYDLIHTQHLYSGFIVPFLRLKYKIISTARGIIPKDDNKWNQVDKLFFKVFEYLSLNFSNVSISVSQPQISYLESMTFQKVLYVPNGVDVDEAMLVKRENEHKDGLVFSAARIIKLKGCHTFLQSLQKIDYKGKVKIIGSMEHVPQYADELKKLAEGLNITFRGLIKNKTQLFDELLTAEYFVFPSTKEGLSNMLLEVASLNIPIICSDIEENQAIFKNDEVLYFQTGDEADLAEKILFALNNENEMKLKAERALTTLRNKFTWKEIANKHVELYEELLNK